MQASGLKGRGGKRRKKKALKMHFYTSKTQILPSESMKCNIACVHDQTIHREKQLAFSAYFRVHVIFTCCVNLLRFGFAIIYL